MVLWQWVYTVYDSDGLIFGTGTRLDVLPSKWLVPLYTVRFMFYIYLTLLEHFQKNWGYLIDFEKFCSS